MTDEVAFIHCSTIYIFNKTFLDDSQSQTPPSGPHFILNFKRKYMIDALSLFFDLTIVAHNLRRKISCCMCFCHISTVITVQP